MSALARAAEARPLAIDAGRADAAQSLRRMNWGWWRVRRIALLARARTARRLACLADDVGLRFGFAAMTNWVTRVVLGVRYPGLPFAFLIEASPLGEAARLLVTLHC